MRTRNVHYSLEQGFIHNWLVAGPQAIAIDLGQLKLDSLRQQLAEQYYEPDSEITETPVERGPLTAGLFKVGDYAGSWSYLVCREDHFVEHSGSFPTPHYLRSWAYTQLNSKATQDVSLVLTTHGPADVWLNGQHVQRLTHFCEQRPDSVAFNVVLSKGVNNILVRFEAVAVREYSYAMALQVCRAADGETAGRKAPHPKLGIEVAIPTLIQDVSRRNQFEQAAAVTYIAQDVFEMDEQIRLHWPQDLKHPSAAVVRLQTSTAQIYAEANVEGTAGDTLVLQLPRQIPAGPYRIFIMPLASEYYDRDLRITREISLWSLGRSQYSANPYGIYEERRQEALVSASQWIGVFAEVAKMALGQWSAVEVGNIIKCTQNANITELLGLLGMMYRFGGQPEFPKELLQSLEDCILRYPYQNAIPLYSEDAAGDSDQILSCAAEILAGQRYPERVFTSSGKTGEWHRKYGEQLTLQWLYRRGEGGFSDWDSNSSFAAYLVALSHLVDWAESDPVWEMAAVVMDKLFVTLAVNSYRGIFGSTHGRTCAAYVKGGLLEPTSGISRLMWGMGIFNHHIAGPVSLACMEKYEFPSIISSIALSLPDDMWSRERHIVRAAQVVNKVTHKTSDGMLCSAQDYYPGQKGSQEHIWQATLGHTATVFVTHPSCSSEDDARQPNYWAGNAVLPRVAQWKDVLIAVHELPKDDWMGFTHAYFPVHAFDEYAIQEGWAFARKGDGYLALTASQGFHLIKSGHYAFRELRSYGHKNFWLCHMGRAALDGDFSTFQKKILALDLEYANTSVRFSTLRGEVLSFGWQGPFLRNDQEQPLSGFEHYENLFVVSEYPSRQLDIRYGESALRLEFGSATTSGPHEPPSVSSQPDVS